MRPQSPHSFKNLEHVLHTNESEHIIVVVIVISLLSEVVRMFRQYEVHFFTEIFLSAKLVLLRHISVSMFINKAHRSCAFHKFAHCFLFVFVLGRLLASLTPSTTSFSFIRKVPDLAQAPEGSLVAYRFFSVDCTYIVLILMELRSPVFR